MEDSTITTESNEPIELEYAGGTKGGITGGTLKWIAIITMLIDHTAVAILEHGFMVSSRYAVTDDQYNMMYYIYYGMRLIGRLGFPLFCFLLVEGFYHTHNVKKYMSRLFLFALLSEIPFNLACFGSYLNANYQNVYFTLLLGMATIYGMSRFSGNEVKTRLLRVVCLFAGLAAAYILKTDYNMYGVLLIVAFYLYHDNEVKRNIFTGIVLLCTSLIEITGLLSFIPIHFYNGKRGHQMKYFFYAFYPVHLLILGLISMYMIR